ncbi:MAG: AI-2E family transporter [Chitinophagaceae bacterium]|nr:AI-2E family transporter [Bacteroidota bacterium]MCC6257839.1 AI-2E family transporter [Chitinophagaceae bacterium]MCW5917462.1 AI-2E family transporter [Ferruginibacter sp.]
MQLNFNERLRQLLLLALIILLGLILFGQLSSFLPGILGGVTLYILSRALFFKLTVSKKWHKGLTALLFILSYLVIIAIPFYLAVRMISPKIQEIINNQDIIVNGVESFVDKFEAYTGAKLLSDENLRMLMQKVTAFIPQLLNSTASLFINLIMMFFLLYYLLVNGTQVERYLSRAIPLKPKNIGALAKETRIMIRANALGIPIISIVQGFTAALGYWIFGLKDWGMWGFLTGVFAFFPLVGTMIIWVPLVIYLFINGQTWPAVGLAAYSVVVTGNIDYITRLGLMKKMGDVHPVITVLGVIVGLELFGFIGLIFGPLLVSYFVILVKIYMNEFSEENEISG